MKPSIIDMTGVVEQDDAIGDVVYDAIGEAESAEGLIPEWGARTIARALADETDDPQIGALHHYAVTGRINHRQMLDELAAFTTGTHDEETNAWAGWLEAFVRAQPDDTPPAASRPTGEPAPALNETGPDEPAFEEDDQIVFGGSAVAKVDRYLQEAFTAADRHKTVIPRDDARVIATLLAAVLGEQSAMHRFAEDDEIDRPTLLRECSYLVRRTTSEDVSSWLPRLEQFISAQPEQP
jgi:hypothetical protein